MSHPYCMGYSDDLRIKTENTVLFLIAKARHLIEQSFQVRMHTTTKIF